MKKLVGEIAAVWECIGVQVQGKGKVLSKDEISLSISQGKKDEELEIIVNPGILRVIERIVINETKKLVIKDNNRYHLLRYLAFYGGIEFRSHKIKVRDTELFYALGYIFRQALRRVKNNRIDEDKTIISNEADKIVRTFFPKKRLTSIFYRDGLFQIRVDGKEFARGVNVKEVILSLKKLLGVEDKKGSS